MEQKSAINYATPRPWRSKRLLIVLVIILAILVSFWTIYVPLAIHFG